MALVLKDRVKETTTTTGTGTLTLGGAVSNFQAFSSIGNGNTTYYVIEDTVNNAWEVGLGTYTLSGTTLSRDTVLDSSNGGSLVTLAAGTKNVFCAYPAGKAIYDNAAGVTNITSTDVTTALGYTPVSNATTLTVNGTTYDLSANRTWSVGTVTSVAALTLGTTGTDVSSTVATGTTTPVITLNIPTASATNRGALSSTDWSTFNNKQPAGTYLTSVSVASSNGFTGSSSGGATPTITLTTSITGMLKGNGTAISAGTAGTDYVAPATATNFTAQQYFGNVALTDAATISWAANTAQVATFTFVSSNRTMGAPTGLVNGAFYALAVIQNAGSNTLTWNSVFKWAGGTAPTLSTAASAKDYFVFRSDGTNLYEQGRSLGVA